MGMLDDIKKLRGIYVRCPLCAGEFRAREAGLFDAKGPIPDEAARLIEAERAEIAAQREDLRARMKGLEKTETAARTVNIGKVVEKIATTLDGFPAHPKDCRSLFDPIDLVVFDGMARLGRVEAIHFVEVKSGGSQLNARQRQIRDAVLAGKVEFALDPAAVGGQR
jgi:predicted Holliday junction resolvase-like endonuclease